MKNIDGGELDIYSTLELDPCHKKFLSSGIDACRGCLVILGAQVYLCAREPSFIFICPGAQLLYLRALAYSALQRYPQATGHYSAIHSAPQR
jgi:hypothetical protein